ncbi:MAG: PstS family phosphate ABC transporter substrate-binding protein [Xenococcus sp. (in: cyanobacteria)]
MNVRDTIPVKPLQFLVLGIGTALLTVSCSTASQESSSIKIDGSSTVYPITKEIVGRFQASQESPVEIGLEFSGTGGGFDKFCRGETDISNASRPIQLDEMAACDQAEVRYIELPVAFDALTVVVNPQNTWLNDITLEELAKIWSPTAQQKITNWNQVSPDFPDQPLSLYGPGSDSGTFDYFTEAIIGESGASRTDYIASEDDDVLVEGVKNDPNALGYFGLAYYEQHPDEVKAVAVDSGNGPVLPSEATVVGAIYQPLSRPLFIYVNAVSAQNNPALRQFIDFYLAQAPETSSEVGYIPLPEEAYHINKVAFHRGEVGTVFEGKSQFNLTISELLKKQPSFQSSNQ